MRQELSGRPALLLQKISWRGYTGRGKKQKEENMEKERQMELIFSDDPYRMNWLRPDY